MNLFVHFTVPDDRKKTFHIFCIINKKKKIFLSPLIPLNFTNSSSVVVRYNNLMITENEIHNICKYNKRMASYRFENMEQIIQTFVVIEEQFLFIIQFSTRMKDSKKEGYLLCFQFDRFSYRKLIHSYIMYTV